MARVGLNVHSETWPLGGRFVISRGGKTAADVVVVELEEGALVGRGECVPYARYGETVDGVMATISALEGDLGKGLDRKRLQEALPPGAARNALDCALWDLDAKRTGRPAWQLAGLGEPGPVTTAYTISLGPPEEMATAAARNADRPLLKLKLGGRGDLARVRAVRGHAPGARLIVDANEAWSAEQLTELSPAFADLGVELIEQPLPAGKDEALATLDRPVPVCADESCHDRQGLARLGGLYDAVNVKLDKAGGLTEALALVAAARTAGFGIMVGCMLATSLAMAPALLVAQLADFVDLDGPLLLERDRERPVRYTGNTAYPPDPALWG